MLALAILDDSDSGGNAIVETSDGTLLKCISWGTDTDPQLVAYSPSGKTCDMLWPVEVCSDIAEALRALEAAGALKHRRRAWYRRLKLYAAGVPANGSTPKLPSSKTN